MARNVVKLKGQRHNQHMRERVSREDPRMERARLAQCPCRRCRRMLEALMRREEKKSNNV